MTTGLIIGYGRAGQRHGKILQQMDIGFSVVEPNIDDEISFITKTGRPHYFDIKDIGNLGAYDFAVICTPPALHLEQINQCLEAGLSVLCEKPLCALGQLEEAKTIPLDSPVMAAYNYRYHPDLIPLQGDIPGLMLCRQRRDDLPEWGLLLDHVSHDLDIINWLTGGFEVTSARHIDRPGKEEWIIKGWARGKNLTIKESVAGYYTRREAMLMYPNTKTVYIDPSPQMYSDMWQAFLSGNYYPGLKEAIETQELLEVCNAIKS